MTAANKCWARVRRCAWADEKLALLLKQNGPALVRHIEELIAESPGTRRQALKKLLGYLTDNMDRMWYGPRLAAGRPIGSGLIEGGCKTILGARLKLNMPGGRRVEPNG